MDLLPAAWALPVMQKRAVFVSVLVVEGIMLASSDFPGTVEFVGVKVVI